MSRWASRHDVPRGAVYDERWKALEAAGESIHGEADLIASFEPGSVLDAGCGTGRVAIELARRGIDVVGADLDQHMLDEARAKAPEMDWRLGDLLDVDLERTFDVVAMPGNVMIFVEPGTEAGVITNMARHIVAGGLLIAGFQLKPGRLQLATYDECCERAGLTLVDHWSTWDCEPYEGGDYVVSCHRSGAG